MATVCSIVFAAIGGPKESEAAVVGSRRNNEDSGLPFGSVNFPS